MPSLWETPGRNQGVGVRWVTLGTGHSVEQAQVTVSNSAKVDSS